jgi:signal peptidase II
MAPPPHRTEWSAAVTAVLGTAVVFLADRLTKWFFFSKTFSWPGPFPSIITIVHHENHGIVANLPVPQMAIIAMTLIIVATIVVGLLRAIHRGEIHLSLALGILIGGALGNLFDRVANGYVFDWILLVERSAINLADASIVLGAVMYVSHVSKKEH